MSLSKKEILSIAQDSTTTFYLYKDQATSDDLIKIIRNIPARTPVFMLLPIVKTISEYKIGTLTDEVKYELLYTIGIKRNSYTDLQQIVDMFHTYNISVPGDMPSKLVEDILSSKTDSLVDKDCKIWAVINCMKPKFTKQIIKRFMDSSLFYAQSKLLEYILNQLVADKDFTFILEQRRLFNYLSENKPEVAKQIVKSVFDTKQLDWIAERLKEHPNYKRGILFSNDLTEQMVDLCLKEHRADLVFNTDDNVFDYVTNTKPALARAALQQLFEDKKEEFISSNPKVLSYILKYEPELLKKLSAKKTVMETVKPLETLALLNKMPLPDADLEFAYIKRDNKANNVFPTKEKLSPETRDYIDITTGKYENTALFKKLTPRVISALIDCHFNNQSDWYKIMEDLLIANPNLDTKFIQQMLNKDKKVEVLIKRHWKGGLKKMRFKKFISEKKQAFMKAFGIKQKVH